MEKEKNFLKELTETEEELETKAHEIAEKSGIEYIGKDSFGAYNFNDPETESTFAVKFLDEKAVREGLEKIRKGFEKK